jgi:phosphomannomutase
MVRLSFGTAGIRAPMGDGDDQLNLRTVRAAAHGIVGEALASIPDARERGLCLGFDGRALSREFAREIAGVALAAGMRVRRFDEPVPTPLVAFSARRHAAALGIVVTASHNPPADNGIKVYWEGGAQIRAPHDAAVAARIASTDPSAVATLSPDGADASRLHALASEELEAYLDAVEGLIAVPSAAPVPKLAYTAMCGVGSATTRRLLARLGIDSVAEVEAQAQPRADFGGLASPNPEDPAALAQVLALADRAGSELVFAHDPDADRLAVAVRTHAGEPASSGAPAAFAATPFRVLSGDEVGALLGAFMLELAGAQPVVMVSTLVSSGLLGAIARAGGASFERTLTGFKHISRRGRELAASSGRPFVFGYEEAIGYGFFALGDDKDGIAALRVLVELARRLGARGLTLEDELERLSRQHGLFATRQLTVRGGMAALKELVEEARTLPAAGLLGPGATSTDYLERPERADLLVLEHPDGTRASIRPSGTEPKLKVYLETRVEVEAAEPLDEARRHAAARLDALAAKLRAHGLG